MKTPVTCEGCHRRYEVDERFAGKTIKCSYCEKPMLIPAARVAAPPAPPDHDEYALGDSQQPTPSAFRALRTRSGEEWTPGQSRDQGRSGKKTKRRSQGVRSKPSESAVSLPTVLIALGAFAVLLAVLGYFVPGAAKPVGLALAVPGLLLCIYGYATGVYIAFTEDGLYGWLFLLFPFYAAYYVVSRWDEMRSRLFMVAVGLTLLAIGGRFLEANRAQAQSTTPEAAADV